MSVIAAICGRIVVPGWRRYPSAKNKRWLQVRVLVCILLGKWKLAICPWPMVCTDNHVAPTRRPCETEPAPMQCPATARTDELSQLIVAGGVEEMSFLDLVILPLFRLHYCPTRSPSTVTQHASQARVPLQPFMTRQKQRRRDKERHPPKL